jgi:hypothetical protein
MATLCPIIRSWMFSTNLIFSSGRSCPSAEREQQVERVSDGLRWTEQACVHLARP